MMVLRSVAMAFLMFSRVPMPKVEWKPENMRFALAALPLVGVLIGALLWGWAWLCGALSLGKVLFAAGMTLLPLLVSGGIHLDGFCDTVDALSSHASMERKREILKDPHTGAFAVIGVCAYFLATFALYTELPNEKSAVLLACLIPVLSRGAGALASFCTPSDGAGLLHTMRSSADRRAAVVILAVWYALGAAGMLLLSPLLGGGMALTAALCAVLTVRLSKREFGGMSGDLAGFCIQVCELGMLCGLIFLQKAVAL
ncbi:MAG: adenosylcobinamide-GDP ribazoletransferase [Clostridiaceae bacterium]